MGHLDIVNILLFWGCYADGIDCEGRTVLSVAAAEGSAGVVQVLLDRGLDENHRDNAGWGPLHYAGINNFTQQSHQLTRRDKVFRKFNIFSQSTFSDFLSNRIFSWMD